jgi:hypothetical protein
MKRNRPRDTELRERLRALAHERRRFGYRRLRPSTAQAEPLALAPPTRRFAARRAFASRSAAVEDTRRSTRSGWVSGVAAEAVSASATRRCSRSLSKLPIVAFLALFAIPEA